MSQGVDDRQTTLQQGTHCLDRAKLHGVIPAAVPIRNVLNVVAVLALEGLQIAGGPFQTTFLGQVDLRLGGLLILVADPNRDRRGDAGVFREGKLPDQSVDRRAFAIPRRPSARGCVCGTGGARDFPRIRISSACC